MGGLHLPQSAASVLARAYNGDAKTSDFDKWLICTIEHALQDAQELYRLAVSAYNDQALRGSESEWESVGFLKPANQYRPDLQSPPSSVFSASSAHGCTRERYDGSGNEGPDNQGSAAPHGQWQLLVYPTGCPQVEGMRFIPDSRGGPDFPLGEATLVFRPSELSSIAEIQEDFLVAYAETIRYPTVPATGRRKICKVHPELFVVVEG